MKPFLEQYDNMARNQRDMINFQAFMTGIYVQKAIASCFDKSFAYPTEPLDIRSQAEIDEFHASPQYQEQQKIMLMVKMNQDERRERLKAARRGENDG